jgi:NitT/TauT family transport system ATP-binding protein
MVTAIELSRVTQIFPRGVAAVRSITATIGAGELVSLLGPSGCGKTTVLRLIAGLERPSDGEVKVGGEPAVYRPVRVSYVFQEPTLMPWASALDNVALPLRIAGQPRSAAQAAARQALQAVGLADKLRAHPAELSGGMKMRCSLARALVTHPSVLLLDEPFAALDDITRQKLNDDLLAQWSAQSPTAVFVTHNVFEAVYLSQRVLVMGGRPGRLIADLPVSLPYPRTPALRLQEQFLKHCRSVSEALERGRVEEPG